MSDVDISPEAAKWALDLRCRVVAYKTDIDIAQFIERQDTELTATQEKLAAAEAARDEMRTYMQRRSKKAIELGDKLTVVEAQLTTAQAQIESARNEGLEMAAGKLAEILQDRWNDWCADTGCFPGDFTMHRKTLSFRAGTWAEYCANDIRALKSTPAPDQSARELTDFMEWLAHNNWLSIVLTEDFTAQSIVNVYRVQRLDAFNTQDNSNE